MLTVTGSDFDLVNTPDALVRVAPDLHLAWDGKILRLHGQLGVPEAAITPQIAFSERLTGGSEPVATATDAIAPSPDVVVLTPGESPEPAFTPATPSGLPVDGEVDVIFGDAVRIDAVGFKSRIDGKLTLLHAPGQQDPIPKGTGVLSLREGSFRSFGQNLEIEWGRIIFDRMPVTEPELDIRAVRWIENDDQVKAAGLHLTGTPAEPKLDLFSRPQLDDDSIQSYLLTGRAPDSNERMLSIGTRLRDDLYVGYGVNLLERTHEFNLRYDIFRRLGLGADVGEADKSFNFSYTWER